MGIFQYFAMSRAICARIRIGEDRCSLGRLLVQILFALVISGVAAGEEVGAVNPNRVEAAFLRNFAHYVDWPADAFADARSPWRVCVAGRDPFGEVLEKTLNNRTEQGRPFSIYRGDSPEKLPFCHILFIAFDDPDERRAVLGELKDKPVLTVGTNADFLGEGGIIRFRVNNRVHMSINLDQARAVSLKIQTKMLEVADQVIENGTVHTLR